MYCEHCGAVLPENAQFCCACGGAQRFAPQSGPPSAVPPAYPYQMDQAVMPSAGLRGFSPRINDPAFAKYIKNSNRWAAIFSLILAVAAVVGFYIAGESGAEGMSNPDSLYIGFAIAGMFLIVALFQIMGRKRSKTWDGTVEDKKIKKKTERQHYGDDNYTVETYLEYSVIIRSDHGKRYVIKAKDDDTLYNYYRAGDRVRHHAGLKSYEKYDKTGDRFIPCNACATLNDINEDYCHRCQCPLLK